MVRSRLCLFAVVFALIFGRSPAVVRAQESSQGPTLEPPANATAARPETAPASDGNAAKNTALAPARATQVVGRSSIIAVFARANPMLWLLGLCSIVTVGFTFERMIGLRRGRVIPRDFVHRFLERLSTGKLDRDRAIELCRSNESPAARVFGHAVRYWGQPSATIRQAVDHDAAREVLDLRRNIRVLNGTATLAPLLGLLGTVIGMIQSFDAIGGKVGGGKSEALAQGISLALISTAIGLGIAVVAVSAYYYLLNRVDLIVRDLDDQVRQVIDLICAESLRPIDRRIDHVRSESRIH